MPRKIAAHITERLMYDWPQIYWMELLQKLTRQGDDVYLFSDELPVQIKDTNPKLHDRLHLPDAESEAAIGECDLFIGFPLKYADMAKRKGVKTILLQAATNGPGVKTSVPCGGCRDNVPGQNDCMFGGDGLCLWEITPNDVMAAVNA
jgi:ADP-heptose:LPS heptosyltransferase